jgi:hypothetical protein
MKLHRLAIAMGLVLGSATGSAMAAEDLLAPLENRDFFSKPGELLQQVAADPANARIEIVAARADAIRADTEAVQIDLPGGITVEATRRSHQVLDSGNQLWTGSFPAAPVRGGVRGVPLDGELDHVLIVRSGDTLLANIRIGGELYRLVPIDGGAHALVEVDQSKFPPDESDKGYAEMVAASEPESKADFTPDFGPKAISTIRVLVAFGASATAAIGNEQQAIDLAFAEANQALAATNTEIVFQQAGPIRFYTQSETTNYSTMLSRLTNQSDGFYDAIGGQRNTNTADIVAYVAPASTTLCGQAAGIATSNANAYFVISPNCLSGNWTFVHEAGHVVGTRHDNDPTTTPYAYGHGFVIPSISRRTVMAVNNGSCSTCTRFGAFSSPNYTLSGVPIGTANFNDNTRVWKTRGPTVAAFR